MTHSVRGRTRRPYAALLAAVLVATALTLLPVSPAAADPGPTTLAGLTDDGVPPVNGAGSGAISADGSTVVFRSFGADVDEDAPANVRVFARDREASTTEAVDLRPNGTAFSTIGGAELWDVSEDGRYVAFDAFQPGTCVNAEMRECYDVYRRDLQTNTTELVSVATDGATAANGDSSAPRISADGQRIVFSSQATDLVDDDLETIENVYVHDFTTDSTSLVSRSTEGAPANAYAGSPAISADGGTVAFTSTATNLASPRPSGIGLYLHDIDTGTTVAPLPSVPGNYPQYDPSLSGDGETVAFLTRGDVLASGASTNDTRAYVLDTSDGSVDVANTAPFTNVDQIQLSDDSRFLGYRAGQGTHVADLVTGTTDVESVRSDGTPLTTQGAHQPISGDGRFVVFETLESVYPGDEPDTTIDLLVHDRAEEPATASGTGAASTGTGGPTYDDTLEASVSGSPGAVTVTELATEDPESAPIDGYAVLGQQVQITAAPATPPAFLTFTFDLDASIVPGYAAPGDVDVFRNGTSLPTCVGPADVGPCVASRSALPSGDWRFVAHSPQASVWAVALDEAFTPSPSDAVPPTVTLTRPANGATYVVGQNVTAAYQCADADSGIDSCVGTRANGARIDTASIGTKAFTVTATDNAGNTATRSASYRVVWPLSGLQQPIDNPPVLNTVKAAAIVPAKFTLGGNRGTQVFASGYPRTQAVACPGGRPRTDEIEQTLPKSAATLTYRNGVYTYAWRTQKAWASRSTCRQLVIRFKDGQQRTALFRLR